MKSDYRILLILFSAVIILFLISIMHHRSESIDSYRTDIYPPVPRAFFKLELPEKQYERTNFNNYLSFEKPIYSDLISRSGLFNLDFPDQNASIYITYHPLQDNLSEHVISSRNLAYKHDMVADAISELVYINDEHKVYGVLYDYNGITATATQFYLTDSINHFFRGALYFDTEVTDSLLPVNNFLKQDVRRIIESFRWVD